jgi:hypothetical protein
VEPASHLDDLVNSMADEITEKVMANIWSKIVPTIKEEILLSIKESIVNFEVKCKKELKAKQDVMGDTVKDFMSRTVDLHEKTAKTLTETVERCRIGTTEICEKLVLPVCERLTSSVEDIKCTVRERNIIIHGLKDEEKENSEDLTRKVKDLIHNSLNLKDVDVDEAYRIGKHNGKQHRSIKVCLTKISDVSKSSDAAVGKVT